ncbi:hypothetical protein GUJ93_ZPchr0458g22742 [Zizania palustris]|uniref:Transcription repressor n=1 Tax=Zizania palustris TaxID=103762 RepID=A0A8J5UV01_ZIZPA|nr:hypothetical protein GUJ93_ZPchr0458g22742 [Zizania palustris]
MSSPCSPPSLSASSSTTASSSWQWPSCTQARTLSFTWHDARSSDNTTRHQEVDEYKTVVMNPTYLLDDDANMPESLSTADVGVTDDDEVIIRGLRSSNRLFFEPDSTSSIVVKGAGAAAFDGATAMSIDSADPYGDFRRSMEEMVMSHINGATDWGWLEEMLGWYLRANGKKTHGLIVEAFVDLLVTLASPPSPAVTATTCICMLLHLHASPSRQDQRRASV